MCSCCIFYHFVHCSSLEEFQDEFEDISKEDQVRMCGTCVSGEYRVHCDRLAISSILHLFLMIPYIINHMFIKRERVMYTFVIISVLLHCFTSAVLSRFRSCMTS